jgi:hypothetical protein
MFFSCFNLFFFHLIKHFNLLFFLLLLLNWWYFHRSSSNVKPLCIDISWERGLRLISVNRKEDVLSLWTWGSFHLKVLAQGSFSTFKTTHWTHLKMLFASIEHLDVSNSSNWAFILTCCGDDWAKGKLLSLNLPSLLTFDQLFFIVLKMLFLLFLHCMEIIGFESCDFSWFQFTN